MAAEEEQRAHSTNQDMAGDQELVGSSSSGHDSEFEDGDAGGGGEHEDPAAYRVNHQLRSLAHQQLQHNLL